MKSLIPTPYETAKQERKQFIIDWLGERLQPEKKPGRRAVSCSGWPRTSLLLVIQNSAITNDELAAEKMDLGAYSNEEELERFKYWQQIIKQRQQARWLPITTHQVA